MGGFSSFDISATGLFAQRTRLDVIANNIANAETTRTIEGGPYRRQHVTFQEALDDKLRVGAGVEVESVEADPTPARMTYDPGHPDAGPDGYVAMPNVNVIEEMVNMTAATRSYEANVTAMNAAKTMFAAALEIGRA